MKIPFLGREKETQDDLSLGKVYDSEIKERQDALDILQEMNMKVERLLVSEELVKSCDSSLWGNEVCSFLDDEYLRIFDQMKKFVIFDDNDSPQKELSKMGIVRDARNKMLEGDFRFSPDDLEKEASVRGMSEDKRKDRKAKELATSEVFVNETNRYQARTEAAKKLIEKRKNVEYQTLEKDLQQFEIISKAIVTIQKIAKGQDLELDGLEARYTPQQRTTAEQCKLYLSKYIASFDATTKLPDQNLYKKFQEIYSSLLESLDIKKKTSQAVHLLDELTIKMRREIAERTTKISGIKALNGTVSIDNKKAGKIMEVFAELKTNYDEVLQKVSDTKVKIEEALQDDDFEQIEGTVQLLIDGNIEDIFVRDVQVDLHNLDILIDDLLKNIGIKIALPDQNKLVPKLEYRKPVEECLSVEQAIEILSPEKVFGPAEVAQVWEVELKEVPPIPYSREDLEKAKKLGMYLILRLDHDKDGRPLTGQRMNELKQAEFDRQGKGKILNNAEGWYKDKEFFTKEKPQLAWALTSCDIMADSVDKDYIEQIRYLRESLKQQGWLSEEEEKECSDQRLQEIREIMENTNDSQRFVKLSELIQELMITQNHRLSFAETLYDFVSILLSKNKRNLLNKWNWTKSRTFSGDVVIFGMCDGSGASVVGCIPDGRSGGLGVAFSR